ncbi:terminase small subunit [Escherichia coli]|uniref:terminase small subunit n=1 Tax=Escherichia coli TaxID=562 RepID=UPI000907A82C|nr:terminase small subunit [Escherichia coli]EFE9966505.1 terminase small subunit [Escherichia coli]EGM8190706.1 terminase small subunit [Escherichia coli]QMO26641.1 terminase small subunit [Escherichia coli]QMO36052.1 terminase small subunit [Escherichia coli]QMO50767.1 terminase small subunit [Escherichia coli]
MASKKLTAEQQRLFDVLTPLQKRFSLAIIKGKNQTEAYRKAGGKAKGDNLRKAAHVIATNCDVQAFIKSVQREIIDEAIMTREEALKRLSKIGRASIADIAEFSNSIVGEDEDGNPVYQAVWSFKDSSLQDPDAMSAVSELTSGKDGIKLKMHDPKAAIKQLAELQGWEAPKKTELTGAEGGPIKAETTNLTADQAAEIYRKMMG